MSDAPRDIAILTFDLAGIAAIRVFVLLLYTKCEVRRPFRSEDMTHFRSQHYIGLVTLTFASDLETGEHYCPWDGQPSYQFWCFYDVSFSTYLPTHVRRIT